MPGSRESHRAAGEATSDGQRLEVNVRKGWLQAGNESKKILKWVVGMQPADSVNRVNRLGISRCSSFKRFFKRHGVRARRIFFASEGTQTASRYAGVGGI